LTHVVPEIDFCKRYLNFNLLSFQIELIHEINIVQVTPKTNVMQLTIKTQGIFKNLSFWLTHS